jgi:hypothetical protein
MPSSSLLPSLRPPLRIGLLVDRTDVSKYVRGLVHWAQSRDDLSVSHMIILARTPATRTFDVLTAGRALFDRRRLRARIARELHGALLRYEAKRLQNLPQHADHLHQYDIAPLVPNHITLRPVVSPSGLVYQFSETDLTSLRELQLDLLIRVGSGILRGGILHAAKMGILSFHHGDNRVNRGGPAGFWEVFHGDDYTGFVIQQLTEELDGGNVLVQGRFRTEYFYLLNQAAVYDKSNWHFKALLERIAALGELPPAAPKLPYSHRLYRRPTASQTVCYFVKLYARIVKKRWQRLAGINYCWKVAFTRSHWRDAVFWRGTTIPNPDRSFLADPFLISRGGIDYCFVEEYRFEEKRGAIAAYRLDDKTAVRLGVVLNEPFHLSFPYLFECDGECYMCPETSGNRDIRIYKSTAFPLRWSLECVLMTNISAADTMIFPSNGKWWMLTNIDPSGGSDHCAQLHLYWSDHPLTGLWHAHPCNPLKIDADGGRNGGLLRDGDRLFRVGQRQGFDLYGKGAVIHEITVLTISDYQEVRVVDLDADFAPGILGTHHCHCNGSITVYDYLTRARQGAG